MTNPICGFDFTLGSSYAKDEHEIISWLTEVAKKWCFQQERGEIDGYLHYQGRFSLKVKQRLTTLLNKCPWKEIHLSPTSKENHGNDFYVTKEDTRVHGPWSNIKDTPIVLPKQFHNINSFFPFQEKIINLCATFNTRSINVIYAPGGGEGKSTICGILQCTKRAQIIPPFNDIEAIMGVAMGAYKANGPVPAYLIDMPRALKKDKLGSFYAGIESLKNGFLYDKRYEFKQIFIDSPAIIIFCNELPEFSLLSRDRWVIWTIDEHKDLIPYVHPETINTFSSTLESKNNGIGIMPALYTPPRK